MSVRKDKRVESDLVVLEWARQLAEYSLNKCANEKIFPARYEKSLINRINDDVLNIVINIQKANDIKVHEYGDYLQRQGFQLVAKSTLEELQPLIDLSYHILDTLTGDMVEYWTFLLSNTLTKLKAWMNSDKKRFKNIIG